MPASLWRQRPCNPLPRYLRITGATVRLLILFFLQYAESNHSASPLGPLLVLQLPQHRVMFHTFGCLTERPSMCSQLARLLRLRVPIPNLSLQYTHDLSLRATCRTIRGGMRYFFAFLRTRDGIPHLFVISSPSFLVNLSVLTAWGWHEYRPELPRMRHRVIVPSSGYFGTLIDHDGHLKLVTEGEVFRPGDELRGLVPEVGLAGLRQAGAADVVLRWNAIANRS